jgi:glutathione-independent formaldehyde dehydrogenase
VDSIPERLQKAEELGAVPIDFSKADPVEQIFKLRKKNRGIQESLRPGEEKMKGVDCAIDAVGYQARDDERPDKEKPTQVLDNCVRVVNPTGSIGMIGVYIAPDPGAKNDAAKRGVFPFPLAELFRQGNQHGEWTSSGQKIQRIPSRSHREWPGQAQSDRQPSY